MKKIRNMPLKDKILLIIAIAAGGTLFELIFVFPFWSVHLSDKQIEVIIQITMIVFLALLVLYIACFFKFYGKESKAEKAEKYVLSYDTFSQFHDSITEKLHSLCFSRLTNVQSSNGETLELLLKKHENEYFCVVFLRQTVVQENTVSWAEQEITVALQSFFEKQVLREKISLLLFVCVDRVSPTFYKIVDGGAEQSFKTFRLPVGISFGGKKIYLPQLKGFWGKREYHLLVQNFMELFEWPEVYI